MSIHIILEDGGRDGELVWKFADDEYEWALALLNTLHADRDRGLLLIDGTDSVWLEKISGRPTAWQKILAAIRLKLQRSCRDGSRFGNERWPPGRGTKPPAS